MLNNLEQLTEVIDNIFYVDVIYCNFRKTFDKALHKRLLKVLQYCCIPSKIVEWAEFFLTNRKQGVIVNSTPLSWHYVINNIPQVSVLDPILFVIYINTLIEVLKYSALFLFADNNKLFKII